VGLERGSRMAIISMENIRPDDGYRLVEISTDGHFSVLDNGLPAGAGSLAPKEAAELEMRARQLLSHPGTPFPKLADGEPGPLAMLTVDVSGEKRSFALARGSEAPDGAWAVAELVGRSVRRQAPAPGELTR
jgi:hypothetical protein